MNPPTPLIYVLFILALRTTRILTYAENLTSPPDTLERRTELNKKEHREILRNEEGNGLFFLKLYWERGYK